MGFQRDSRRLSESNRQRSSHRASSNLAARGEITPHISKNIDTEDITNMVDKTEEAEKISMHSAGTLNAAKDEIIKEEIKASGLSNREMSKSSISGRIKTNMHPQRKLQLKEIHTEGFTMIEDSFVGAALARSPQVRIATLRRLQTITEDSGYTQ